MWMTRLVVYRKIRRVLLRIGDSLDIYTKNKIKIITKYISPPYFIVEVFLCAELLVTVEKNIHKKFY